MGVESGEDYDMVQGPFVVRYGMARYGTEGTVRYGMARYYT